ncbi:hypothetical protein ADUPG1_000169, partial [Aduncisulcus paluster]
MLEFISFSSLSLSSMYPLSLDELSANSSTGSLGSLIDSNQSSYWQSNLSCPHKIFIKFSRPIFVKSFYVHTSNGDGNYQPDRLKITFSEEGGVEHATTPDSTARNDGWSVIPCPSRRKIERIELSIESNHDGGCDCRVRNIAVEQLKGVLEEDKKQIHLKSLAKDFLKIIPSVILGKDEKEEKPQLIAEEKEGIPPDCSVK